MEETSSTFHAPDSHHNARPLLSAVIARDVFDGPLVVDSLGPAVGTSSEALAAKFREVQP
jgi:hypothetical protein